MHTTENIYNWYRRVRSRPFDGKTKLSGRVLSDACTKG